jgi:hypothetical protein
MRSYKAILQRDMAEYAQWLQKVLNSRLYMEYGVSEEQVLWIEKMEVKLELPDTSE